MSRTSDAMAWVAADPANRSYYAAAKLFNVSQSALTQAKLRARAVVCPSCGARITPVAKPEPTA